LPYILKTSNSLLGAGSGDTEASAPSHLWPILLLASMVLSREYKGVHDGFPMLATSWRPFPWNRHFQSWAITYQCIVVRGYVP
jgi:hypothetical protein